MSVTNHNPDTMKSIMFVKSILPDHYTVTEAKKLGSVHCKSEMGIRKPPYTNNAGTLVDDAEDEKAWDVFFEDIKNHFGDRFQEVFHNTCFCHTDFTIYLKNTTWPTYP